MYKFVDSSPAVQWCFLMALSLEMSGPYLGKQGLLPANFLVQYLETFPMVSDCVHWMQTSCKFGVYPCASSRHYCPES